MAHNRTIHPAVRPRAHKRTSNRGSIVNSPWFSSSARIYHTLTRNAMFGWICFMAIYYRPNRPCCSKLIIFEQRPVNGKGAFAIVVRELNCFTPTRILLIVALRWFSSTALLAARSGFRGLIAGQPVAAQRLAAGPPRCFTELSGAPSTLDIMT